VENDGCIVNNTASTVTVTPGTQLVINVMAGSGPQPTSCTWNGVPIPMGPPYFMWNAQGLAVSGDTGKLICDNKDGGGKDVDRITVTVQ
jgi:hypothetical protein